MDAKLVLYVMFSHVMWVFCLYGALTVLRAPNVWGMRRFGYEDIVWSKYEKRVSANLSNQFEWPLFFHVIGVYFLQLGQTLSVLTAVLAVTFIVGRLVHSYVQILNGNTQLRGLVFTVNFVAVLGMWWQALV